MSYYFDAVLYSMGKPIEFSLPAVALDEREQLPKTAGVYLAVDVQNNEVIYVGQSKNLRKRWSNHNLLTELDKLPFVLIAWFEIGDPSGSWLGSENSSWLISFEQMFIDYYQPILNSIGRKKYIDFKVKLSLEDYQRLKQAISHTKVDRNKLIDALIVGFLNDNGY